jgi:hypothetical protein
MMLPENAHQKLIEEIELFIDYGVEQQDGAAAKTLVRKYQDSPQALAVLLEFYKVLPEAREEAVTRLGLVDSLQGVTLLSVSTARHDYLAVVSEGEAQILCEYGREQLPEEILAYFGHADSEAFEASCGPVAGLPEFAVKDHSLVCPACRVAAGELHLLGCPVEICPWCDGQLSRCNCRFEKLEVESVETEEQVEAFRELLEARGRIAYQPEQKPAYPGTSEGLDR